jgi:hypothetical protein
MLPRLAWVATHSYLALLNQFIELLLKLKLCSSILLQSA